MKFMRSLLVLFILVTTYQLGFSQSAIAKFKFEEAEEAFSNNDFMGALTALSESERMFGKTNLPILYLRIQSQQKLLEKDIYTNYNYLDSLKMNCDFFLTSYGNDKGAEEKLREVYKISQSIKKYPANKEELEKMRLEEAKKAMLPKIEAIKKLIQFTREHGYFPITHDQYLKETAGWYNNYKWKVQNHGSWTTYINKTRERGNCNECPYNYEVNNANNMIYYFEWKEDINPVYPALVDNAAFEKNNQQKIVAFTENLNREDVLIQKSSAEGEYLNFVLAIKVKASTLDKTYTDYYMVINGTKNIYSSFGYYSYIFTTNYTSIMWLLK